MEDGLQFYRDTWAEINLDSIAANVRHVKQMLPKEITLFAVVKANAYGHGAFQVAKTALEEGASYLAVAFLDEAIALRKQGIDAPILVLGASRPQDVNLASYYRVTLTVFQKEWVEEAKVHLNKDAKLTVHIKIDTGMGRIGVREKEELTKIEELLNEDRRFALEGAFTHFATADESGHQFFDVQLRRFTDMVSSFKKNPPLIHAANSAATIRYPNAYFNGVRLGIVMYGLTPSLQMEKEIAFPLEEAFSLRSKIVHVKKLLPGDKVSYGATYEAKEEEWIGTLPIGYADGWIRKLQGQEVLVDGIRAPIVGRICMDQCMIKLPHKVKVGTVATLIGRDGSNRISINEIACKLDTINYEIPCMISTRVPRVFKKSGKTVECMNHLLD